MIRWGEARSRTLRAPSGKPQGGGEFGAGHFLPSDANAMRASMAISRLPALDRLLQYDPVMLPTIGAIRQVLLELEHVLESLEAPESHSQINKEQVREVIDWLDRIGDRLKSEIWVEQEGPTGWQAMIDGIYLLHEDLAQHLSRSD